MGKRIFRHSAHPPESLCFFVDLIASIEILKSKTEYLMRRIAEDSRKLNALSVLYHKLSRDARKIYTRRPNNREYAQLADRVGNAVCHMGLS